MICIPQVAIADDDYGWGLVDGTGRSRTGGAVTAGSTLGSSSTGGELVNGSTSNRINGILATANDGANDGPVILSLCPTINV